MKQIFFLAITLFSLNSFSQNCNIGNENPDESTNSSNMTLNFLLGVKYTLSQEGTLNSINLIGNDTGVGVQMAVYNDNNGSPNNLIVFGNPGTVGNGVTSFPVTPVLLPAGNYWVMAVYEQTGDHINHVHTPGNVIFYCPLTYGSSIPTNTSEFTSYNSEQGFLYFLDIDCSETSSNENYNFQTEISIFPNPSSDFISIPNLDSTENYVIFNQLGQQINNGIISDGAKIDISDLSDGVYFLKIGNRNTTKFVKK